MLTGKHVKSVQVGYESKAVSQRKEGEEWIDARGRSWKIEEGKRKQITKVPPRGFDKCSKCKKLILKSHDQQTYDRMTRCYHCQLDFEVDLKASGKWKQWVAEQEKSRFEAVKKEIVQALEEANMAKALKADRSVVNAINNARSKGQIK